MKCKYYINTKLLSIVVNNAGYSLPTVLIISLLLSSLLFGVLYLTSFYIRFDIWKIQKTKLDNSCESAINIVISDSTFIKGDSLKVDISGNEVVTEAEQRGLLFEVSASAIKGRYSSNLRYLIGQKNNTVNKGALIVSRPNFRGAYTGETKITGKLFATTERLSAGRIAGIKRTEGNFHDGELVKNEKINANYFDHSFFLKWLDNIEMLMNRGYYYQGNMVMDQTMIDTMMDRKFITVEGSVSIEDSIFMENKRNQINVFAAGGVIINENSSITGCFNFFTDSSVTIKENSYLRDVIFSSEGDCTVSNSVLEYCQIFSKRNIRINSSYMKFPGIIAAYVDCDKPENLDNKIELTSSSINGTVMLLCSTIGLNSNKSMITFDSGSKVQGLVYSENFTDSECDVIGTVYTYELFFYKSPTEYRNWLVNTNINFDMLDEDFLLPFGFSEPVNAGVLKREWIN